MVRNLWLSTVLLLSLFTSVGWAEPLARKSVTSSVFVEIYLTEVNGSRAWAYKTSGLKTPNLTITLLVASGEGADDYPQEPINLLKRLVRDGAHQQPGKVLKLKKPFLTPGMTGLLFVPGDPLPNVPGAQSCLAAVSIFDSERQVAKLAGSSRLMGGLANQVRYYPCPVWCDRTRKAAFTPGNLKQMREEPASKVYAYHSKASAMVSEGTLSLRIAPKTALALSNALEAHEGFRLSLLVDPRANAFLIWTPELNRPAAVNPHRSDGSRMAAQHLLLLPNEEQECRLMGDGYVVFLTPKNIEKLATALKKGVAFKTTLGGSGPRRLELEWIRTEY